MTTPQFCAFEAADDLSRLIELPLLLVGDGPSSAWRISLNYQLLCTTISYMINSK